MCKLLRYLVFLAVTASGLAMTACGSTSTSEGELSPEIHVNTYTRYAQENPSIASLNDGGFLMTWESPSEFDDPIHGVFAQRYNSNGDSVGEEFRVNTYTDKMGRNPSAAALSDGGFVVAWQTNGVDGSGYGIYAQRFNIEGSQAGVKFQVHTNTLYDQENPRVTLLNDGGFVVTWDNSEEFGEELWSDWSIYAQRFNAFGEQVGEEFQVNTNTNIAQGYPNVTALDDGGFVVAWESWRQNEGGPDIHAQRFSAYGEQVGGELKVNSYTAGYQTSQSVTEMNDGGFIVTWMSSGRDGGYDSIYAQRFNVYGEREGLEFQVNTYTNNNHKSPSVTAMNDGGFMVTWQTYVQEGGWNIYAQCFNANGQKAGAEFRVNSYIDGYHESPKITSLIYGGIVIIWQASDQGEDDWWGIYAQVLNKRAGQVGSSCEMEASAS